MKALIAALMLVATLLSPTPAHAAGTAPVDVRFTTSPDPSAVGETVTLVALVSPRAAGAKPTGTVAFTDMGAPLGSAPVDENGRAALDVVFPGPAHHDLAAAYSGDEVHQAATATSTHTVDVAVTRKRWVGGPGGLWTNSSNWEPPGPPADGDTVVLDNGPSGRGESVLDMPQLSLAHVSVVGTGHSVRQAGHGGLTLTGTVHDDSSDGAVLDVWVNLPSGDHVVDGRVALGQPVTGPGGLIKTGSAGELILAGLNSYGGATTVNAGVVTTRHPAALGGTGTGTTVAAGATLRLEAAGIERLTLHGDGASPAMGALHFAVTADHAAAISLQGERVSVSVDGGLLGRLTGRLTGPAQLRKTGAGHLTVGHPDDVYGNEYQGGTDVAAGTLMADAFIHSLGAGAVDVRGGAVFDSSQGISLPNEVRVSAHGILTTSEFSSIRGPISLNGPTTIRVPTPTTRPMSLLLAGRVSGTGPIRKEGGGSLWFTGTQPNTFTGTTVVAAGTLLLSGTGGNVAAPDGIVVEKGAHLTNFSDDKVGDRAPLVVHGSASYVGTGDRYGSLTATGHVGLSGHYFQHDGRKDFGVVTVDSLHMAGAGASLGIAVEERLAPAPGETHDLFRVGGTVSLSGRLYLRGNVPWGTTITVVDNVGTAPVSGTFEGAPEGALLPHALRPVYVSYRGGDGNDVTLTAPPARSGYWMLGADGAVYPFGDARHHGDARAASTPAVDIEPTSTHNGYWILLADGTVLARGDAPAHGSVRDRLQPGERATSISKTPWNAYWVFTDRGRALPVGQAGHFGDMAGRPLNGPVLGSVGTPSGTGYYMVGSDGGIFAFGNAEFRGSMGGKALNGPVVGLSPDPDWTGYWLVADDGGIFAFDAPFRGSMGGRLLNRPVVGMVPYGDGYLMVGSDGGIFNFSSKPFHGSLGSSPPLAPVVSVAPLNEG